MSETALPREFFLRDVVTVARELIGKRLTVDNAVSGIITEAEAYNGEGDPAAHSHNGMTPRCRSMFAIGGTLYVYRIHQVFCINTSTGPDGFGAGVLIRGIHVTDGQEVVRERRNNQKPKNWTNGPGKVAAALSLNLDDDGQDLCFGAGRVRISNSDWLIPEIECTPRIGISKAKERLWRFVVDPSKLRSQKC